jgi:carbon monoxide dehydrogenase subunit G
MKLTGQYTLNASAQTVWTMLMNPDTLTRIVPFVTSLESTGEDTFTAIAQVKMGPVKDSFSGNLTIKDKVEPQSFTLSVQQNSKSGNAAADIKMKLAELNTTQTEVRFEGDVRLSGTLAIMGGRVLTPIAASVSKQFFQALEKEITAVAPPILEEMPNSATVTNADTAPDTIPRTPSRGEGGLFAAIKRLVLRFLRAIGILGK